MCRGFERHRNFRGIRNDERSRDVVGLFRNRPADGLKTRIENRARRRRAFERCAFKTQFPVRLSRRANGDSSAKVLTVPSALVSVNSISVAAVGRSTFPRIMRSVSCLICRESSSVIVLVVSVNLAANNRKVRSRS